MTSHDLLNPFSLVFICRENPRRGGILLLPDCPRFCRLMKTRNRKYPRSSGMDGDKSGESGASLFSRLVPDFCAGRRSFPTNENSNVYRRGRTSAMDFAHYQSPNTQVSIFGALSFPTKFIGRIRERIVAIIRFIWDGRQKVKAPIVWDFPDMWKPGLKVKFCFLRGPLRWLTAAENAIVIQNSHVCEKRSNIHIFQNTVKNVPVFLYAVTLLIFQFEVKNGSTTSLLIFFNAKNLGWSDDTKQRKKISTFGIRVTSVYGRR